MKRLFICLFVLSAFGCAGGYTPHDGAYTVGSKAPYKTTMGISLDKNQSAAGERPYFNNAVTLAYNVLRTADDKLHADLELLKIDRYGTRNWFITFLICNDEGTIVKVQKEKLNSLSGGKFTASGDYFNGMRVAIFLRAGM